MTLKSKPNFEEKLAFCLKTDIRNLVNFNASGGKTEHLDFDKLLCRKYVMFELKNTDEFCCEK